jgi:hypothetical protein
MCGCCRACVGAAAPIMALCAALASFWPRLWPSAVILTRPILRHLLASVCRSSDRCGLPVPPRRRAGADGRMLLPLVLPPWQPQVLRLPPLPLRRRHPRGLRLGRPGLLQRVLRPVLWCHGALQHALRRAGVRLHPGVRGRRPGLHRAAADRRPAADDVAASADLDRAAAAADVRVFNERHVCRCGVVQEDDARWQVCVAHPRRRRRGRRHRG